MTLSEEGERQRLVVDLRLRFFSLCLVEEAIDEWESLEDDGTAKCDILRIKRDCFDFEAARRNYRARPMTLISVIYRPLWLLGS